MVPVVCLSAGALAVFLLAVKATSKYCDDGHICSPPRECCASGCCHAYGPPGGIPPPQVPAPPPPSPPSIPTVGDRQHILTVISWNHWYFWFLLLFLLVSCLLGGCGWLRRRRLSECRCCCCCCCCFGCPPSCRMDSRASDTEDDDDDDDEEGEGGWGSEGGRGTPSRTYGPRCVPYHSPPPYSEVTSKPDLYPLVISVGGGNGCGAKSPVSMSGSNNGAGGYLMVHFFRNYFVRPVGSLSATSTVDSLSSSFLCSAANEANTLIPPPYPCEEDEEEVADERTEADEEVEEDDDGDRGRVEEDVTDDDNRMASRSLSGRRGRFRRNLTDEQATDVSDSQAPPSPSGASWSQAEDLRLAFSGSEVSSLGLGTPCSPPRATTPTPGLSNPTAQPSEELRDLLDKIQRLPGAGGSSSGSGRESGVHGKRRTSTGGRRDGRMTGQRRGSGWLLLGPSGGKVVGGAGTKSAPTTPSTHFAPGLFRPASVTRGPATDGGSPLLSRNDSASSTHEEEGAVQEEEEEQDETTSPSS